jgi:hypothetical protein
MTHGQYDVTVTGTSPCNEMLAGPVLLGWVPGGSTVLFLTDGVCILPVVPTDYMGRNQL